MPACWFTARPVYAPAGARAPGTRGSASPPSRGPAARHPAHRGCVREPDSAAEGHRWGALLLPALTGDPSAGVAESAAARSRDASRRAQRRGICKGRRRWGGAGGRARRAEARVPAARAAWRPGAGARPVRRTTAAGGARGRPGGTLAAAAGPGVGGPGMSRVLGIRSPWRLQVPASSRLGPSRVWPGRGPHRMARPRGHGGRCEKTGLPRRVCAPSCCRYLCGAARVTGSAPAPRAPAEPREGALVAVTRSLGGAPRSAAQWSLLRMGGGGDGGEPHPPPDPGKVWPPSQHRVPCRGRR